ncbi:ABC transporter membrane protein [Streptococcus pneumoniae]|nr:ABC transporter membrane protein [Streptococcus pneumoniae]
MKRFKKEIKRQRQALSFLEKMKRFKKEVAMNSKAKQVSLWERIKKQKLLLLMTVPGLVLTFIFKYIPMYGVLIAFKDYNPLKGMVL